MIYDLDSNVLTNAYDLDSNVMQIAYDLDGNVAFVHEAIPLKAMTYNVGQWYIGGGDNVPADKDAEYYALQNGMIQNADADVLFLCEYWNVFSKTGRTALSLLEQYYPYIQTAGGASGYYGRTICSKYPMSNWTHHSYTNETSRYYDSVDISVEGIPVTLIVTHLSTDQTKRRAQAIELFNYLQTLNRFIVAGDFNTVMNGSSDEEFITVYTRYINAGYHLANGGTFGFFNTHADRYNNPADGGCLDNIITSADIQITAVSTDQTKYTDSITDYIDHIPLIVDLSIGS